MHTEAKKRLTQLANHFSEKSDYWEGLYSNHKDPPNFMIYELSNRKKFVLQMMDNFANNKKLNILDIGCGTGHYLEEIIKRGHNAFGSDIAKGMLLKCKNRLNQENNSKLLLSNIESLPFPSDYFDLIICVGVIEYLSNISISINEMRRILKNNGLLIITAPNMLSIKFMTDPYYLKRFVKFIGVKTGLIKIKKSSNQLNVALNDDFNNKRFFYYSLKKLFSSMGFKLHSLKAVAYGPQTFWLKPIFALHHNIRTSEKLVRLSALSPFKHLIIFANRWVIGFEIKK